MRMVGPNCIGISNTDPSVADGRDLRGRGYPSGTSGWSPSPAGWPSRYRRSCAGWASASRRRCPRGDKYDVSGNDLMLWWHHDPGPRWPSCTWSPSATPASSRASPDGWPSGCPCSPCDRAARPPGQRAAASHTASTATPRVIRDALFRQAGVLAVDRLDELFELIAVLSWQPLPAGRRIAVISNAGGCGGTGRRRVRGQRAGRAGAGPADAGGAAEAAALGRGDRQPGGHRRARLDRGLRGRGGAAAPRSGGGRRPRGDRADGPVRPVPRDRRGGGGVGNPAGGGPARPARARPGARGAGVGRGGARVRRSSGGRDGTRARRHPIGVAGPTTRWAEPADRCGRPRTRRDRSPGTSRRRRRAGGSDRTTSRRSCRPSACPCSARCSPRTPTRPWPPSARQAARSP